MSRLVNLTALDATCLPSMSRDDRALTLLVAQGRFSLPTPGSKRRDALTMLEPRREVGLHDLHYGHPASSSLRREGQSAYTRPGTDVSLAGHAWATGERPAARGLVDLQIGSVRRTAAVFGEREWSVGLAGGAPRPGRPEPFINIPLRYERCLGGVAPLASSRTDALLSAQNPVGRGLYASPHDALGKPLPNFEDPMRPIEVYGDWPAPHGFGPIARHWLPRRSWAGTYDDQWLARRVPLWPADLDERFFSAAPPGLCVAPYLVGGEPVHISGMSSAGPYDFQLPRVPLQARFEIRGRSVRQMMILDAIDIDTTDEVMTMTWRTSVAVAPLSVNVVVLRALSPWEVAA